MMTQPAQNTECKKCTVPAESGDTCNFCRSYVPPANDVALVCDQSVNMVDVVRHDLNDLLQTLPRTAPLFSCLDIVTALGHLRQAAVLIDRAADALEIEGVRR